MFPAVCPAEAALRATAELIGGCITLAPFSPCLPSAPAVPAGPWGGERGHALARRCGPLGVWLDVLPGVDEDKRTREGEREREKEREKEEAGREEG